MTAIRTVYTLDGGIGAIARAEAKPEAVRYFVIVQLVDGRELVHRTHSGDSASADRLAERVSHRARSLTDLDMGHWRFITIQREDRDAA